MNLDFGLYTAPKIFYIHNKIYVAITDTQASKVYVFDSQAELLPGFPVYGNSEIEIENIDAKDAEIVIAMKDKKLTELYPTITKELVQESVPGLIK